MFVNKTLVSQPSPLYNVEVAYNLFHVHFFNLMVFDLYLPAGIVTGRIQQARQNKYAPIMMLFPGQITVNLGLLSLLVM